MSGMNVANAVTQLDTAGNVSLHRCAHWVRLAIEAGGVTLIGYPINAKDYGPCLARAGFTTVADAHYSPIAGDIIVFQPYAGGNTAGHIQMYDGRQWVSDFKQPAHDYWPGPGYRNAKAAHAIYRP